MAEVGNITIEEARELASNRLLWPLVRDFLWDFAPQVHESWLEGLEWRETLDARRDAGSAQASCLMSSTRVKAHVLGSLGVEPCFHTFPADDGSRLLLLDGATLELVVKWLGALACADALRRVTDGATVRRLKAALPGVYPEVFGYTAYFRYEVGSRKSESLTVESPDEVVGVGWHMLQHSMKDLPESLRRRLALKLPKRHLDLQSPTFRLSAFDFQPSTINLQLLLKLRFQEAYKLCCS